MRPCPGCDQEMPDKATFCMDCGTVMHIDEGALTLHRNIRFIVALLVVIGFILVAISCISTWFVFSGQVESGSMDMEVDSRISITGLGQMENERTGETDQFLVMTLICVSLLALSGAAMASCLFGAISKGGGRGPFGYAMGLGLTSFGIGLGILIISFLIIISLPILFDRMVSNMEEFMEGSLSIEMGTGIHLMLLGTFIIAMGGVSGRYSTEVTLRTMYPQIDGKRVLGHKGYAADVMEASYCDPEPIGAPHYEDEAIGFKGFSPSLEGERGYSTEYPRPKRIKCPKCKRLMAISSSERPLDIVCAYCGHEGVLR
jgi:hypothetical protein